jgi:hypothetical protein
MKKLLFMATVLSSFDLYGMLVPAGDSRIAQQQDRTIVTQVSGEVAQLPHQRQVQQVVARTEMQPNFIRNGNSVRITFRDRDDDGVNIGTYSRDYLLVAELVAGRYEHNLAGGFSNPMQNLFANITDIATLRGDRRVLVATEPSAQRIAHQYTPAGWQHDNAHRRSTSMSTVFITDQGQRINVDAKARVRANSDTRNHVSRGPATQFYTSASFSEGNDDCRRYVMREIFDRPDGTFYSVDGPEQVARTPKPRSANAVNTAPICVAPQPRPRSPRTVEDVVRHVFTLGFF